MSIRLGAVLLCGLLLLTPVSAQDEAAAEAGAQVYEEHCATCHGEKLRSAGAIPDLRELGAGDRARFDTTLREGRSQMPAWEGVLTPEEIGQVWAYVQRNAR